MEILSGLFLAKVAVSISVVIGLSLVAEHLGPRAAGFLTGMPLGAGIIVVFTGMEQGTVFTAEAAGFMVPGFVTTLAYVYLYAAVAAWRNKGGVGALLLPTLVANLGYGAVAYLASLTQPPLLLALPVMLVAMFATSKAMKTLPNTPITERVRFGMGVAVFRAVIATLAILVVTGVARAVGPQWTGILTAYPLTLFPLIVVIHVAYRGEQIAAVLKHVPMGLGSVLSFCVTIHYTLPTLGLALGVATGYAAAFCYLAALSYFTRKPRTTRVGA